jgi:hypothetical protein
VDHIICDIVGACVASTLEEMEWNAQDKGIYYRAFHFGLRLSREEIDQV